MPALVALIAATSLWVAREAEAQTPSVELQAAATAVAVGETLDVHIMVADVTDLADVSVQLEFDAALLEVVDAYPSVAGTQITPGGQLGTVYANAANNSTGSVQYGFQPADPITGSFELATVRFRGKAIGENPVSIVEATLLDSEDTEIEAERTGIALLHVNAAPTQTHTPTATRTQTATWTATATPTATSTADAGAATETPTPTATSTASATGTPATATATPKAASTPTAKPAATVTPSGDGTVAAGSAKPGATGALPTAGDGSAFLGMSTKILLAIALILAISAWAFYVALSPRRRVYDE